MTNRILPPLVISVVCLLPLWGLWLAAGPPMEEGFMLVFPELVLDGSLPNRDFLHLYGPGSLWVLAAVYWVFGVSLGVQRVVGFLQHLGVAFGVYALLRPWGPWVAGGGGAIAALIVITPSGLSALAWIGGVALGLWFVNAGVQMLEAEPGSRRQRRLAASAGLLAGAALLYRLDLVLAVGLAALVILAGLDVPGRKRLVAWAVVGVSPYLVHLATAGVGNVVHGMVIEPVFDLRGGRRLPLPPSWDDFDGFLQRAGLLDEPPWPFWSPRGPVQLNLWLAGILAATVLLVWMGVVCLRRGDRRLLAIAAFSAGLLPQALQRADSTHLAWVSCVTFAVLPAALVELRRHWSGRVPQVSVVRSLAALAVPILVTLVFLPDFTWRSYADSVGQTFGHRRAAGVMEHDGREFRYARPDAVDSVNALVRRVDEIAEPGDRLFVGPGDLRQTPYSEAFLYYLLPDLVPATRYIEMDPGVANAPDSEMADELAASDIVVLSSIRDDWNEPNESLEFGSDEPNQVLAENFCLVASYGEGLFGRGLYELYERC
ncbi:hypothetical protein [Actinospongicola halichondriae]|uniref:hypothetical protein n=1 Tax=Actinospongicola halichondriae TaxID=3236844 RepID=UPI003D3B49F0